MAEIGPGADCLLCGTILTNAEVRPTHYTAVTYMPDVRTRISEASYKDFVPLYARLVILLDIDLGIVWADYACITHGTQEYIKGAGR
jgi:hypothetical protein